MRKKTKMIFEEEYFKGKSNYTSSYAYKAANIELVYKERAKQILKKFVPRKGKILDAAFGFGDLLVLLDKSNYATYGIDLSKYGLAKAKKNTKAQLILGDLNKRLPYKDDYFDAIFAMDIIEHLESPYKFLLELRRVLKKDAIVLIQTPNINSLFEIFSREKWFGYRDETHLFLFNRKSLQFLLNKSGFHVINNETICSPFPSFLRSLCKNTDIGGNLWIVASKV